MLESFEFLPFKVVRRDFQNDSQQEQKFQGVLARRGDIKSMAQERPETDDVHNTGAYGTAVGKDCPGGERQQHLIVAEQLTLLI